MQHVTVASIQAVAGVFARARGRLRLHQPRIVPRTLGHQEQALRVRICSSRESRRGRGPNYYAISCRTMLHASLELRFFDCDECWRKNV